MRAKLKLNILISLLTVVGLVAKAEARTVNVAVPTLSMVVIAFTAAKEKGYYQEEGLDVNWVVMRDTLGISALIGGAFVGDGIGRCYRAAADRSTLGDRALPGCQAALSAGLRVPIPAGGVLPNGERVPRLPV